MAVNNKEAKIFSLSAAVNDTIMGEAPELVEIY
jgi:hypothetical protein